MFSLLYESTEWCDSSSRANHDYGYKVYVQDLLKQYVNEFWPLIKTASIYVCGDAKNMAKDVQKALMELAMEKESLTEEQAQTFLTKMTSSGRYLQDIWT